MKNTRNIPSGAPLYPEDTCPVCKAKATSGCRCSSFNGISNDRSCPNGHEWYWDNGKKILGSHHNLKREANMQKKSEDIKSSELFNKYVAEGKSPQEAAVIVLDIITNGAFVAVEEPRRQEIIQKVIDKYSVQASTKVKKIKFSKKEWNSLAKHS